MPFLSASISRVLLLQLAWLFTAVPGIGREEVEIKVLCFPKQAERATIEMHLGGEEVIGIDLQSHEFTLPQKVPRLAEWRFGRSGTDPEGRFTFDAQARVTPLAVGKQLLVFFRKGPRDEDGFSVVCLDPAGIGGRDYLVFNLTDGPVAGLVGGKRFHIAPGRRALLAPEADRGENLCFADLRYRRNDEWRSFFTSNWRLRDRSRAFIFVHRSRGQGPPRLHSVIDPL